ncbi:MalY/PatB family protein [Amycolatopsis saalfeldensis]|uniref:MalY/PatB family protein n=1 Tax=Amycolatopsis saalfeldensis TaxID=394193 RepID=UPI001FE63A03|nr:aminotransferase class I/II-fold pyridoxal phosphate-dependent enzyme [Amycolatopsis saalfeldensis]
MASLDAQDDARLAAELDRLDPAVLRSGPGKKWRDDNGSVLPAWIADMDFPIAPAIRRRLSAIAGGGALGYPRSADLRELRERFALRMAERYDWKPPVGEVVQFTGVTQGVHAALYFATEPGDPVAMHTPAFGPFRQGLAGLGRPLVPIPMIDTRTGWAFDADRFAHDVAATGCRVLLLVNPHNPTGRMFTREELRALAEVADRHDLLVIADEVHADLAFPPDEHIPFASLDPEVEARTITITSAAKAFNLAGTRCAVGHVGCARLRRRLAGLPAEVLGEPSTFGVHASIAAWTEADGWLTSVLGYLAANRRLVAETLREELPEITMHRPEATYLAWLDCRALGWGSDPARRFRSHCDVRLSSGTGFDPGGEGFVRLNFATSRPILQEILRRMVRGARAES